MIFYTFFKGMIVAFALVELMLMQRERIAALREAAKNRANYERDEAYRQHDRAMMSPFSFVVTVPDTMPEEL